MDGDIQAKNKDDKLSLADIDLNEFDLPPIRTLQGDLAKLLEKNKLTKSDFNKLDKDLRRETEDYQKRGGDRKTAEDLKLFVNEMDTEKKHEPDEISKLFKNPHESFTNNAQKRARINAGNLKKNLIYESSPNRELPQEDFLKNLRAIPEEVGGDDGEEVEKEDPLVIISDKHLEEKFIEAYPKDLTETEKREVLSQQKDEVIEKTTVRKLPKIVKKQAPEPPPKPSLIVELERERSRVDGELKNLPGQERVVDETLKRLEEHKERLTNFISPLVQKEAEIEERIIQIEGEEAKITDINSRKQFEKTRWALEDQRREMEEKRWQVDQEIIKLQKEIEDARARKQTFTNKKISLGLMLETINKKKRAILAEKELSILREKLKEVEIMKEPVELEWISLNERKVRDASDLSRLRGEEEGVEAKLRDIQIQERETSDPKERHSFEAERWKTEEVRREIEKKRWIIDEEFENIISGMKELGVKYKKILEAEKLIVAKIHELETLQDEVGTDFSF